MSARHLGEIVDLLDKRRISKLTVDFLIMELLNPANSLTPKELVEKNNLEIISNPKELRKLCQRVVDRETGLLGAYKKRKKVILKDLISKAIEETNYRADTQVLPSIMAEVINEKLERES